MVKFVKIITILILFFALAQMSLATEQEKNIIPPYEPIYIPHLAYEESNFAYALTIVQQTLDINDASHIDKILKNASETKAQKENINKTLYKIATGEILTANDINVLQAVNKEKNIIITNYENFKKEERAQNNIQTTQINKKSLALIDSFPTTTGASSLNTLDFIANGLAEFVVDRAKQEASLELQEILKEKFSNPTIHLYLPNTYQIIVKANEVNSLITLEKILRTAVNQDIDNLPDAALYDMEIQQLVYYNASDSNKTQNLQEIINQTPDMLDKRGEYILKIYGTDASNLPFSIDKQTKDSLEKVAQNASQSYSPDTLNTIMASRIMYAIYQESKKGREPLDILRGLSEIQIGSTTPTEQLEKDARTFGKIFRAFEANYKNLPPKAKTNYQDKDSYDILTLKYAAVGTYLALSASDGDNYIGVASTSLDPKTINTLVKMYNLVDESKNLMTDIQDPNKSLSDQEKLSKRIELSERTVALLEKATDLMDDNIQYTNGYEDIKKFKHNLKYAKHINKLGRELLTREPGKIMLASVDFMNNMAQTSDYQLPDEVIRYSGFVVEIANASSGAEVAKIIDAAAMPVGSWRMKEKKDMLTLNAFFGGIEHSQYYQNGVSGTTSTFSLFAPVGIQYTWAKPFLFGNYWGVFVSALDLGPLVVAREQAKAQGATVDQSISLQSLFSPGIYVTSQLIKPVTWGFGCSTSNGIVKTAGGSPITEQRCGVFMAIDIPVFPFN